MSRLALILHAGDYLDARRRRDDGQGETYRHHHYALGVLEGLASAGSAVAVVQCHPPQPYEVTEGSPPITFVGGDPARPTTEWFGEFLDRWEPDRIVLRTPDHDVVAALRQRRPRTITLLADSFGTSLRQRLANRRLGRMLDEPWVEWVGNHHLNASLAMHRRLGVRRGKVVPWDWPSVPDPADLPPKAAPSGDPAILFFAGAIRVSKGVTDLVRAAGLLAAEGLATRVRVAGAGATEEVTRAAAHAGADVTLLGRLTSDEVLAEMREADVVVVPSRAGYPEGLPLTIYEALCSRTPLVASDHPMFAGNVVDGASAAVFRGGDVEDLAATVRRVLTDRALYGRLSEGGASAWQALQIDAEWGEVIRRWLADTPRDTAWLRQRTLTAMAGRLGDR